ncbi:MAG: 50S ribosomal protein L19 [Patescibacteria group bacterium]|nr:MAG: 50S ribosomal protein L19 [Patescibacteria group bacterium]WKZ24825.1 MAG: 50S ribosomal protein L19 [Patescibacteria group bacterium]
MTAAKKLLKKKSKNVSVESNKTLEEIKEELKPGMSVRIYQKIKELNPKGEEKERVQYFDGLVIARKHGKEVGSTITVRKVTDGVGVEKIYPLNLPTITKIEVQKQARVRRAKLYYLRSGYNKRLKEKVVKEKVVALEKK